MIELFATGEGIPSGLICVFAGTEAELAALDGWRLCNGQNGTPDLRDRFVMGSGSTTLDVGGYIEATLPIHSHTAAPMSYAGSHNHFTVVSSSSGGHDHVNTPSRTSGAHAHMPDSSPTATNGVEALMIAAGTLTSTLSGLTNTTGAHSHTGTSTSVSHSHTGSSSTTSSHTHTATYQAAGSSSISETNFPPYYALAFIQKV